MRMNTLPTLLVAVLASCSATNDVAIHVQANELGVTALKTDRYQDGDADVYELRALGESDEVLGTVTLKVAPDAELSVPGLHNLRADIRAAAGSNEFAVSMRAIGLYELPNVESTELHALLQLEEISATLLRDVNIRVPSAPVGTEAAYTIEACNASQFLPTPTASKCCGEYYNGYHNVQFFNLTAGRLVRRQRSPSGNACRTQADASCTGVYDAATNPGGCYYGPNSMAVTMADPFPAAAAYKYMGTDLGVNYNTGNRCFTYYYTSYDRQQACGGTLRDPEGGSTSTCPFGGMFPNITGTYPRGHGCCAGAATASVYCCGGVPSSTNTGGCLATGANPVGGSGAWDY
jgi:hypothetical protein